MDDDFLNFANFFNSCFRDFIDEHPILWTTTTSAASALTFTSETYDQSNYDLKASQAYVQSLSEEELSNLIGMLEGYNIEDSTIDENKVYKKTRS